MCYQGLASTAVSGTLASNTHWTTAGTPYLISSDVTVPAGVTLTVDPGVTITYTGAFKLKIGGAIIANGNPGSPIVFGSAVTGTSSGATMILFDGASLGSSQLSYVQLLDATDGLVVGGAGAVSGALTCSHLTVKNATVRTAGASGSAKLVVNDSFFLLSTLAQDASSGAIETTHVDLSDTSVQALAPSGIKISGSAPNNSQFTIGCCGAKLELDHCSLTNSPITETGGGGVASLTSCTLIGSQIDTPNTRVSLSASSITFGVSLTPKLRFASGVVTSSTITGSSSGTALEFTQGTNSGSVTVSGTTISNFAVGVKLTGVNNAASYTLGELNSFSNIGSYFIENRTSRSISASTNYWGGLTGNTEIAAKIYDQNDDGSVGPVVVTSPLLAAPFAPWIFAHPSSASVPLGSSATLSVQALGSPTPTLQWYKNGTPLSGATSANLTFTAAAAENAGDYYVVATNALGAATSSTATLSVVAPTGYPSITLQPESRSVFTGGSVVFTVTATGVPSPSYQWLKDGSPLAGETSPTLSLSNIQLTQAGSYTVTVSNTVGSVTSLPAVLSVSLLSGAPTISTHPVSQTALVGQTVTFSVTGTGTPSPTYQWMKDGVPLSGANSASFSITNVQLSHAGTYTVSLTNNVGSATSTGAVLTVLVGNTVPTFVTQPTSQVAAPGSNVTFTALATGSPAPTYQWLKNANPIAGATGSSLTLTNITSSDSGEYAVYASNLAGTALSANATLTVSAAPPSARLVNISTRSYVGSGENVMIAGFILGGTTSKTLLIRASGPSLTKFGVPGVLADPVLELHDPTTVIAANDNWGDDPAKALPILQAFQTVNAFAWELGSKEAAILVSLNPGAYTAVVSGKGSSSGVALIEAYEVDAANTGAKLINISTRSFVQTGAEVQIAGFIIGGTSPKKVIIRSSGPALKKYGLTGVLADPVLELHSSTGTIATNDDWDASVRPDFQKAGIDNWEVGSKDSALVMVLNPGGYTAIVSGKNSSGGVALIEVFEAD